LYCKTIIKEDKMGCWNQTCAVSQIAITNGDPVVCLFVTENDRMDAFGCHYTTCAWNITFLPFRASYNDYGGVEDIVEDWNTDYILNYLRNHAVEKPAGENPYHEHVVVKDNLNWELIQQAVREDRLELITQRMVMETLDNGEIATRYKNVPTKTTMLMIHADVWNALVYRKIDTYRGAVTLNSIVEKRQKKVAEVEKKIADMKASINIDSTDHDATKPLNAFIWMARSSLTSHDSDILRGISENPMPSIKGYLVDHNDDDFVEHPETVHRMAEIAMVNSGMSSLRRYWHPQTGLGSQSDSRGVHRLIHNIIEAIWEEKDDDL
jgi:hypothetical protein